VNGNDGSNSGRWTSDTAQPQGIPDSGKFTMDATTIPDITSIKVHTTTATSAEYTDWVEAANTLLDSGLPLILQITEVGDNSIIGIYFVGEMGTGSLGGSFDDLIYIAGSGTINEATDYTISWVFGGGGGTSGVSGSSGTSGTSSTSGTSGANGTSGTSGTSGTRGTSGTSGTSGANGTSGTSGAAGAGGIDGSNSGRWNYADAELPADLTSGQFTTNSATISAITSVSMNSTSGAGVLYRYWLDALDGLQAAGNAPYLQITKVDDNSIIGVFNVSAVTASSQIYTITTASFVSNGTLTDTDEYTISWVVNGKSGMSGSSGTSGTTGTSGTSGNNGTSGTSGTSPLPVQVETQATTSGTYFVTLVDSNNTSGIAETVYTNSGLEYNANSQLTTFGGSIIANVLGSKNLGTVSGPVFSFTTDSNTGMYSPGADQLALVTGGVDGIRISSGQLVGINRTPTYRLDVSTGTRTTNQIGFRVDNTSSEGIYIVPYTGDSGFNNNTLLGDATIVTPPNKNLVIGANGSGAGFRFGSSTDTTTTVGNVYLINGTTKLGYDTGAGGTIGQITNKSTGVTINRPAGQINMNGAALAANTVVSFTVTNSVCSAGDTVIVQHQSGGTLGNYNIQARSAAGSFTVSVRNMTTGSLSDAIGVSFTIIRSVTS
jgi:hypothetical protein